MARDGFAIVIDKESYQQARAEVDAYARCVDQMHNLHVYTVIDRWGIPDSIRAELFRLHTQRQAPIVGAVLVGDIPIAMVRDGQHLTSAFKMDQQQPREESSVPSDRFYDDFGLRFQYLERDSAANRFYYSLRPESRQRLRPAIYSGRIRPTDAGGSSRYEKLRLFLSKTVAEKQRKRTLERMFFFSGHGYISESKAARMDEKTAYLQHFPHLADSRQRISYIDHTDQHPVKERVMGEVMRTDLDLAILHHHGYWDTQYLNGSKDIPTVRDAKAFIQKNVRQHLVRAKQKGRDWEKMKRELMQKFDLPESWLADALDTALAEQDSLEDAALNLHLEDFAGYGYRPNAPVVVLDACFCGSFHRENCIANEYLFQPGSTVAVVANSVNVLQDKWTDRLIGLIAEGGCAGDIARFSGCLESHLLGDPTYRFASREKQEDIAHLLLEDKPSAWRRLLKSGKPELQSIAIDRLCALGQMTSAQLRSIYETAPSGIVRLMALTQIAGFHDENRIEVIRQATQDSYEMVQRQALRLIHDCGDTRLIPALIAVCIENNTSDRVNFNARMAIGVLPREELLAEFARQFDDPQVQTVRKDSVRALIRQTLERYAGSKAQAVLALDTATNQKEVRFTIRSLRNDLVHEHVPFLFQYLKRASTTPERQVMVLEALGWHPRSHMAEMIAREALTISRDTAFAEEVRAEALKTYNRIRGK